MGDVKPDNILVLRDRGKLCDFGTATRIGASRMLGGLIGTPGYRAPEIEQGAGMFDATLADVWSFGKVIELTVRYDAKLQSQDLTAMTNGAPRDRPSLIQCSRVLEAIASGRVGKTGRLAARKAESAAASDGKGARPQPCMVPQ